MILCGDVGGTRVRLGLAEKENSRVVLREIEEYQSGDWPGFFPLLEAFLNKQNVSLTHACIGAAGPVVNGICDVTHLPWVLESKGLSDRTGVKVKLVNDLAAMAASIPYLDESDTACLQEGEKISSGRMAVVAAGTGLGQAVLVPHRGKYQIVDTEGGQCDFATRDDIDIELFQILKQKYSRVSVEQVLSGPGLVDVFQFFVKKNEVSLPESLKQEMAKESPAKSIMEWGLNDKLVEATNAVKLFSKIYGAVAGNLALQMLARGGVWLGGGIAPVMVSVLKGGEFIKAFTAKGKFSEWMQTIPVSVIMNPHASLLGAAGLALGDRFDSE